jgi:transcriptional regulator with PAS, ATPase and Fis domain
METKALEQARQDVFETNAKLTAIMEAFEGLIYVSSQDYRIIYINRRMVKRKRFNPDTEKCYTALYGRDTPCPFCVMDQVQQAQMVKFEIRDPRNNRWYFSVNTPVFHEDGSISLLAMVTDIHDRKIAEEALKGKAVRLHRENTFLRSGIRERFKLGTIVGKSSRMQDVYEQIFNAASTDAGIILYGEPGTGKELAARMIHDLSKRGKKKFVPVHCGAIPDQLFESEFFGYRKGAFSGADRDRQGYLDFADGGTLFLDEIGEISRHMQIKLLRAIEGRGYTPVGGNEVKISDFRIIAATNRDVKELVRRGKMREDFFYRIHIIPIRLPPLRDRREDIPLLADHFLRLHAGGDERLLSVPGKFYELLLEYDWPGNVRELQNAIVRYCNTRSLSFLSTRFTEMESARNTDRAVDLSKTLREQVYELEKNIVARALEKNHWHRSRVAALLGIDRKTLATKIKRYGLE